MSNLNPTHEKSYEEIRNSIDFSNSNRRHTRRSVSLDSWILDDVQDLYIDDSQDIEVSDTDFSLNADRLEDPWTSHKTSFESTSKPFLSDTGDDVFFSEKPLKLDKTKQNKNELKEGLVMAKSKASEQDIIPILNFNAEKNDKTVSHSRLKVSSSPTYRERNSSFLGQFFSSKKFPNTLQRTKSTDSVHDNSGCSSSKNKESSIFKSNKQISNSVEPQTIQVKTKIRSLWNNMKYGWRVRREANLKVDRAIWLLGECYHNKSHGSSLLPQDVANLLKLDLLSKILFTYRLNFPVIPGTDIATDSGWGCMLRAGQMMMAQALVCNFLHREWRISPEQPVAKKKLHRMILRWFGDTMSSDSPFSIHHLAEFGVHYGRKAGDWYGPTHVAHVLRDALKFGKLHHPNLKNLCMYVASDGIVFKQDVFDLCSGSNICSSTTSEESLNTKKINQPASIAHSKSSLPISQEHEVTIPNTMNTEQYPKKHNKQQPRTRHISLCEEADDTDRSYLDPCPSYSEWGPPSFNTSQRNWESLILFVSVRLGNDKINPFYIPCLKSLLAYENCIGIIGGRPKHALYFVGWQDEKLIHMDPHSCQPAIDMEKDDFSVKSFHSPSIRTMLFSEMDPSCAIGFFFRRKEDFEIFIEKFDEITSPMKKNLDYPVFALAEGKRAEIESMNAHFSETSHSLIQSFNSDLHDDDYILL